MSKPEPRKPCTIRWRNLWRENVRFAKRGWGENLSTQFLEMLTRDFQLSVKDGDLQESSPIVSVDCCSLGFLVADRQLA